MALLGNIVKKAVELSSTINKQQNNPMQDQLDILRQHVGKAFMTSFGLYHGFKDMLEKSDDEMLALFQKNVPIHSYNQINKKWWTRQQKYGNITWPGKQAYYALSSGTTGKKSKRIPVSQQAIDNTKKVSYQVIKSLSNFDLKPTSYEKEVFMLGSSRDLKQHKHGFLEGEISGINTSNLPDWFDIFYRPGKEIASLNEWDDRVNAIVKEAKDWDIAVIAGIPSWVQLILKEIIAAHKLETIHDIWPNLELYISGGVPFEPFADGFNAITQKPLKIMDTYLASEGFFGFTDQPNQKSMKLCTNTGVFYEFIPFDEQNFKDGKRVRNPKTITIDAIEENQDYALIITTASGLWRYQIGDTIRFMDKENLRFVITGRTKFFLNVVGSQLSENKINKVIKQLSKAEKISVEKFCVGCIEEANNRFVHQWIIVTDDTLDGEKAAKFIDKHLKSANKNYKVARNKALSGVKVEVIKTKDWYNRLKAIGKTGGQTKIPKVMSEDSIKKYL